MIASNRAVYSSSSSTVAFSRDDPLRARVVHLGGGMSSLFDEQSTDARRLLARARVPTDAPFSSPAPPRPPPPLVDVTADDASTILRARDEGRATRDARRAVPVAAPVAVPVASRRAVGARDSIRPNFYLSSPPILRTHH